MTGGGVVRAYADAINARDLGEVLALFSEDAVLRNPFGEFAGTGALRAFYRDVVLAGEAVLAVGRVLVDGPVVMGEVSATSPLDPSAGAVHALDVFTLGVDGRIERLDIYYR